MGFRDVPMARVVQVQWLPLLFIPLSAESYVGVPGDQTNEASAMLNLFRNLGGSFGVSFAQTLLQERRQFHHARLQNISLPMTAMAGRCPSRLLTAHCRRRRLS